jgi:hypothetical protein
MVQVRVLILKQTAYYVALEGIITKWGKIGQSRAKHVGVQNTHPSLVGPLVRHLPHVQPGSISQDILE